jgi:catechol 2,3-dioxygenase-like lactoylglutathione lyase family enzyme
VVDYDNEQRLTMADPYLRVHAVNIYVKDQARSLDFYLNTLGFHIAFDARVGSGERIVTPFVSCLFRIDKLFQTAGRLSTRL